MASIPHSREPVDYAHSPLRGLYALLCRVARGHLGGVLASSTHTRSVASTRVAAARRSASAAASSGGSTTSSRPLADASDAAAADEVYQRKTAVEHVLLRPGMYIGATSEVSELQWVLDDAGDGRRPCMVQRPTSFNPGVVKLFDEILVNARDNGVRDGSQSRIDVDIEPGRAGASGGLEARAKVTVTNDGASIPVRMHATEGERWLPCFLCLCMSKDETQEKRFSHISH